MATNYYLKRVYEPASESDGFRVLVDGIWPQGESRIKADLDLWEKSLAPSAALRSWFHADRIGRWEQFREKYLSELSANPNAAEFAREMASKPTATLLYASRDESRNNAAILREYLQKH